MSGGKVGALLSSGLAAGAPIALSALGGLFTEAAGSLSVALEGSMLAGAFAAAAIANLTGNALAGLVASVAAGLFLSFLVGFAATRLGADVFVAGLAANLLATGAASILSEQAFGTKGVLTVPAFAETSLLGATFLGQALPSLVLYAVCALLVVAYALTPFGLRLRAVGERNEAARAAGIDPGSHRLAAHLVAGAASGLAGAALALKISAYVPGMSSGRGWIALVAIYLGGRRPGGVLLASLSFGFLIALANAAQALAGASAELLLALPYAFTAFALVAASFVAKRRSRQSR